MTTPTDRITHVFPAARGRNTITLHSDDGGTTWEATVRRRVYTFIVGRVYTRRKDGQWQQKRVTGVEVPFGVQLVATDATGRRGVIHPSNFFTSYNVESRLLPPLRPRSARPERQRTLPPAPTTAAEEIASLGEAISNLEKQVQAVEGMLRAVCADLGVRLP